MFRTISQNGPMKHGKKQFVQSLDAQKVNFKLGRPEWQQEIKTTSQIFYDKKRLTDNRCILKSKYLNRYYSQVDLYHSKQKYPFLTSNARDYHILELKSDTDVKAENEEAKRRKKFIQESHIKFGEWEPEKKSMYSYNYIAPIAQKLRFNYDKIKFKYNKYNLNPITGELIWKNPKKMYPFDYFNIDKNKRYIIHRNNSYINDDYKKVYSPITHRYFIGTLRELPKINN